MSAPKWTPEVFHVVFDGPPGPEAGRFVEVETPDGRGIAAGEWKQREDGYWVLEFRRPPAAPEIVEALRIDAAGRPFSELLLMAADACRDEGGGPVEDCFRLKAAEINALLASLDAGEVSRG